MQLPVVNHPDYVAKINDDNKFPIKKFGALADHLIENKVIKEFHIPKECSIETMKTSHSIEYINYIKPKKTIFTHMTALLDEKKLIEKCPKNVLPGYDGMQIIL